MAKNTTRDPMYGESKIKGGKHKGPVELFPVKKAGKGGSPGQPYDIPRPDIPHPNPPKYAKKISPYSGKGPASA